MKNYGYTRKKIILLGFIFGAAAVMAVWLYMSNLTVVGKAGDEYIYGYQLRQWQKENKYDAVTEIAEDMLKQRAEIIWNGEEDESFEEYFEEYKQKSDIRIY